MDQGWDSQLGWMYAGEGEWVQPEGEPESLANPTLHGNQLVQEKPSTLDGLKLADKDIWLHNQVMEKGYPNRWGARIPVHSGWNIELLEELLQDYHDKEIVEWIRFGWPTGRLPTLPNPQLNYSNHKGAVEHPEALKKYIKKEKEKGAVMGPYNNIPFNSKVGISPFSTRAKKHSQDRRIILDLSFPPGHSVNDGILKDNYMGLQAKLTFPKVDELACRIYSLGKGCYLFKVDLSRYFRQIPLDPGDFSIIGYVIEGKIYFDKVLPMGMRSAPYITQRISNAIAYIIRKVKYFILNYVDNFVGAEVKEKDLASIQYAHKPAQRPKCRDCTGQGSTSHHKTGIPGNHV